MFGILKEFVRGKFNYHLCSEFYRDLLEGSLVIVYVRNLQEFLEGSLVIIYVLNFKGVC